MNDHHHTAHFDWAALGALLERQADLYIPLFEQAVAWPRELLATGGRGTADVNQILDIGSGPGVISSLLARTFPRAAVVAVDGSAELLDRARTRAAREGLTDRVHTLQADLPDGLDALDEADLIWTSQALHHIGDQQAMMGRLSRLVRPGGLLAVVEGGLPTRFLPRDVGLGRPGLQARLDVAEEDGFTEMRAALPDARAMVEDWPGRLADGGLIPTGSRTFLLDLPAPLGTEARDYLNADLTRRRDRLRDRLDADDLATLDRLLDPNDEAGLLQRPDVFFLTAKTVHTARSPGTSA